MSKEVWDLNKFFKEKTKYIYIGKENISTPHGILSKKFTNKLTGKEWKNILVYDLSENTMPSLNKLFTITK